MATLHLTTLPTQKQTLFHESKNKSDALVYCLVFAYNQINIKAFELIGY